MIEKHKRETCSELVKQLTDRMEKIVKERNEYYSALRDVLDQYGADSPESVKKIFKERW